MKASDVINLVAAQVNDKTFARWTQADLYVYLTEALRQVILVQPRANPKVAPFLLVGNKTLQTLPSDASSLIEITRNLGADGLTPGRAVTISDRQSLDGVNPLWHVSDPSSTAINYVYDDRSPLHFYIYPRPSTSPAVYVEIIYSAQPADVTSMTQDLDVLDVYQGALVEYLLYRCYSVNAKSDSDRQAAQTHLGLFYTMLDQRDKAAMLMTPNNPNNVMG